MRDPKPISKVPFPWPEIDPQGASTGSYRLIRGGSWAYYDVYSGSGARHYGQPFIHARDYGFRIVRTNR